MTHSKVGQRIDAGCMAWFKCVGLVCWAGQVGLQSAPKCSTCTTEVCVSGDGVARYCVHGCDGQVQRKRTAVGCDKCVALCVQWLGSICVFSDQ